MKNFLIILSTLAVIIVVISVQILKQVPLTLLRAPSIPTDTPPQSTITPAILGASIGQRTKTTDCVTQGSLPDSACTPGAIISGVTLADICTPGYSKNVRNVPDSLKNKVYAQYNVTSHFLGQYEVDHLISLELGGSNDIANLWPEPADPTPGFHQKDKVENYLHDQVCNHHMDLSTAQVKIASNWLEIYQQLPQ